MGVLEGLIAERRQQVIIVSGWLYSLMLRDLPLDNYCKIQICVIKIDTAKEVDNGISRNRRKVRV